MGAMKRGRAARKPAGVVPIVFMEIDGVEDLLEKAASLPKRIQKNVARKGVRAGTAILTKEVRRRVPRVNQNLKQSLATKLKTYPNGVVGLVGQDPKKALKSKLKRSGGISGRGKAAPIHLVENPTKRHLILPRDQTAATPDDAIAAREAKGSRKALRFILQGKPVYRFGVWHAGTKGAFFLRDSERSRRNDVQRAIEDKLLREIEAEAQKQANAAIDREAEEFFSG
jgi:hypothetical protein